MRAMARYAVLQGETMPLVSCLEASEALGTSSAFSDPLTQTLSAIVA